MSRGFSAPLVVVTAILGTWASSGQESISLIEHAKKLSDIRSEDAPAFKLKVSYKRTLENDTTVEGTYTERWISSRLWRSELKVGEVNLIRVARDKTLWLQSNSLNPVDNGTYDDHDSPEYLLAFHLDDSLFIAESWTGAESRVRKSGSWSVRCIKSVGPFRPQLCFESTSGALVVRSNWERLATGNLVEYSCAYTNYLRFGEKLFPRSVQCVEGGRTTLQGTVLELAAQDAPSDSLLFAPIPAARQMAYCPGTKKAPELLNEKDPSFTPNSSKHGGLETFLVTVGVDGVPRGLTIIRSVGKDFDKSSADALKVWRFRPATCDGDPMESTIKVEFENHQWK